MGDKIVLADTTVLIDFFRKADKANSKLITLFDQGYDFSISAITHYEIYSGATSAQLQFWESVLARTKVLPFDQTISKAAVEINALSKRKRKQIGIADLFIAATAIKNNMPLATLNRKHFDRIDGLSLLD
ncbi:MAG TPA: type II toxin-antitoxin system VapC family toxin [Flavipsychrobacter sp.]|nr:type II toxin-antitoxin system VapC family toxin [Flavipsychrobacter sp.]